MYSHQPYRRAGVAELADARDLKSLPPQGGSRFDPGLRHHTKLRLSRSLFIVLSKLTRAEKTLERFSWMVNELRLASPLLKGVKLASATRFGELRLASHTAPYRRVGGAVTAIIC